MDKNFMEEFRNGLVNLQQNALMMQSEMSVNNGIQSFSLDQLCVNSADKKITLSQVLKRKLEIMESEDPIEKIMKKRFTENTSQSVIVVDNGVKRDIENEMLISHEPNNLPLCSKFNQDIPYLSSNVKPKMLFSNDTNNMPLCGKFNQDIPFLSSSVKPKMLLSYEANGQPLNPNISLCPPPSVDINLDQKYLTYKKFPRKINEDNDDNGN